MSDAYYCKECTIMEKDVSECSMLGLYGVILMACFVVERWMPKDC